MVHFVGAGPGAPDLITLRGQRLLAEAGQVIYAGSLVNPELLQNCRADCRILDSARMTLEEVIAAILTAEADGLRMYAGTPTGEVLAGAPAQTWSFRDFCPMQRDGEILTPEDWDFAGRKARRTVIGRVNRNNYLILSVSDEGGLGLTLHEVNGFFQKYFQTEWLYNLDGGPSSALLARKQGARKLRTVMGGAAKDMDLLVFAEAE